MSDINEVMDKISPPDPTRDLKAVYMLLKKASAEAHGALGSAGKHEDRAGNMAYEINNLIRHLHADINLTEYCLNIAEARRDRL